MTTEVVNYLAEVKCEECHNLFVRSRSDAQYCSKKCKDKVHHRVEAAKRKAASKVRKMMQNANDVVLNRDRFINKLDSRYTGPLNRSDTKLVKLVRDKSPQQPLSVDVHVRAAEPKFTQVTPEDVDWGHRQGRPTQMMPRKHNSFCVVCVEMVIDKDANKVRTTKGVYLPIEHKCNSVRVYDLKGNLLETKPL